MTHLEVHAGYSTYAPPGAQPVETMASDPPARTWRFAFVAFAFTWLFWWTAALGDRGTISLPVPLTPFFGREKEIEQLVGLLVPAPRVPAAKENFFRSSRQWYPRILTIVGVGGSGKTRLALEVGRACIAAGIRNVCFVALVDTDTPERMLQTIAEAVQPERPGVQEPWEAITG